MPSPPANKRPIISASRRTDIPAFYGEWFMQRVRDGAAGCVNPFNGQKYTVSLSPLDTIFIVFWSKNYAPFIKRLDELDGRGFRFYFQFTITGHPNYLENRVPPWQQAVDIAHTLAKRYSPDHVLWRFDPIIFTNLIGPEQVMANFAALAKAMQGATRRCYFSFVQYYGKVRRNMEDLHQKQGIIFRAGPEDMEKMQKASPAAAATFIFDLTQEEKRTFSRQMAEIAANHGISLRTCCGDYLVSEQQPAIASAHCIDGELIATLLDSPIPGKPNPTRKECGCWESADIGAYDTCPHGCVYCYANMNKALAHKNHEQITNAESPFALGADMNKKEFPLL